MRDAETYEDRAVNCLRAVVEDDATHAELLAQLDGMTADELHSLVEHIDILRVHARREWLHRTTRPSGG